MNIEKITKKYLLGASHTANYERRARKITTERKVSMPQETKFGAGVCKLWEEKNSFRQMDLETLHDFSALLAGNSVDANQTTL